MQIQNPEAAQIIRDQARLTVAEGFPQNLISNVQPVIDMTPRFHRTIKVFSGSVNTTSSSSNSFFTTSSTNDTFLYGCSLSIIKDASCDAVQGSATLIVVVDGEAATRNLIVIPVLTLTAQERTITFMFPVPIKLKRGSAITLGQGTFTTGNYSRHGEIFYTEVSST